MIGGACRCRVYGGMAQDGMSEATALVEEKAAVQPLQVVSAAHPPLRTWRISATGLVEVAPSEMGAFLDKPITTKANTSGHGKGLRYAVSSMQGWRIDMEDAHVVQISMAESDPFQDWSFFAVFDGHAGSVAADDAASRILETLLETTHFSQLTEKLKSNGGKIDTQVEQLLEQGLKTGFLTLDEKIKERLEQGSAKDRSGTTAVCAIVTPTHFVIANLGDSRAVVSKKGDRSFGTEDHKPTLERERQRIVNAGGSVMIQRINGSLAVSRALGDFEYKATLGLDPERQQVSAEPDVYIIERSAEDEFLVLACDGIYDVMTNHEMCEFVESRLEVNDDLIHVCNQVLDACLSKGSRDNMTFLLVCFEGAPKVNEDKAKEEETLVEGIRKLVHEILEQEMDGQPKEGLCAESISRILQSRVIIPDGPMRWLSRSIVDSVIASREPPPPKDE